MSARIAGLALLLGASSAGLAQAEGVAGRDDVLASIRNCRMLPDDTARLACYDAAATRFVAAVDSGAVQVVSKDEIERTRRGLFGFSLPRLGLFGSDEEQEQELASTVEAVVRQGRDGYRFRIAEGSVWEIPDAPRRLRPPRPGDEVVLKRASLGSFFIRIAGQTGVKGRRVE
jgi:hypothetical protein